MADVVAEGTLVAQGDVPPSDIYIISVPTPFKDGHQLDRSYIDQPVDAIIPQLTGGELIILESTVPPGTTNAMARRVAEARPDLSLDGSSGPAVYFAHAPERVLPGRIMVEMRSNDRIVGGTTPEATRIASEVYRSFCDGEVVVTDARTAELSKLAENSFRDVNIAFANELSLICDDLGIDVWELISLANRHPRVNILNPGPGVGGHCIAVDPWFIVAASENAKLIKQAREVNDGKPEWVLAKLEALLENTGKDCGRKIALLGLAFKPNIDDLRESPAVSVATAIRATHEDDTVLVAEPFIDELPSQLHGMTNVELVDAEEAVRQADVVVVLVSHDRFRDLRSAVPKTTLLLDTTGLWRG